MFSIINKEKLFDNITESIELQAQEVFTELLTMLISELKSKNGIPFLQEAIQLLYSHIDLFETKNYTSFVNLLLDNFKVYKNVLNNLKPVINILIIKELNKEDNLNYYNKFLELNKDMSPMKQIEFSYEMFNFKININESIEIDLPIREAINSLAINHYNQCLNFPYDCIEQTLEEKKADLIRFTDIISILKNQQDTGNTKKYMKRYLSNFLDNFTIKLNDIIPKSNILFSNTYDEQFYEFNFSLIILNQILRSLVYVIHKLFRKIHQLYSFKFCS
jgi:hypothetical protein